MGSSKMDPQQLSQLLSQVGNQQGAPQGMPAQGGPPMLGTTGQPVPNWRQRMMQRRPQMGGQQGYGQMPQQMGGQMPQQMPGGPQNGPGMDQMQSRMQASQQGFGPPQISPEQQQADMLRAQGGVQLTPDQQMDRYRNLDQQARQQIAGVGGAAQGMPQQQSPPPGKGGMQGTTPQQIAQSQAAQQQFAQNYAAQNPKPTGKGALSQITQGGRPMGSQ